jgi:hypothetical protein
MEKHLPREIVHEILGYLSDPQMIDYALTSKTSLESCEKLWKCKYEKITHSRVEEKEIDRENTKIFYWFMKYTFELRCIFAHTIRDKIQEYWELLENDTTRRNHLENIFGVIVNYLSISKNKRSEGMVRSFLVFLNILIDSQDQVEVEVANKYYPLLFPIQYGNYLASKYIYEGDEEEDEDDYDNIFLFKNNWIDENKI